MNKTLVISIIAFLIAGFAALTSGGGIGAPITETDITDTFNTFRQNVNTSLQNLNTDKLDTASTTDDLTEGSTNLYYTEARFTSDLAATSSVDSITTLNNLNTVGTLTGGQTGTGFTVDLDSSSLTCNDCIDISANTNLTAGTNITLNDDDLDVDDAFLINDGDDTTTGTLTMSGLLSTASSTFTGNLTIDNNATTTGSIGFTGYDCSGFTNGGQLTVDSNGKLFCKNDATGANTWNDVGGWLEPVDSTDGIIVSASSTFSSNLNIDGNATSTGVFAFTNATSTFSKGIEITDSSYGIKFGSGRVQKDAYQPGYLSSTAADTGGCYSSPSGADEAIYIVSVSNSSGNYSATGESDLLLRKDLPATSTFKTGWNDGVVSVSASAEARFYDNGDVCVSGNINSGTLYWYPR